MEDPPKELQEATADALDAHQLVVREVSRTLWQQVRAESVRRGQSAGSLVNEIFREWLARQQG